MRALFLWLLFAASAFGITQQEAENAIQSGHKLFGEKQWTEALSQYQTALSYNSSAQIFYNIGQCYSAMGKPGFALAYFLKAESIKPHWELLQQTLKQFYSQNTNFVPAEKRFYEKVFSFLNTSSWKFLCSFAFWSCMLSLIYFACIRKNKFILYAGCSFGGLFFLLLLLIAAQDTSKQRGILPEITTARFAPGENSPVRYNWDAGTRCTVKTERCDYYFVNTTFGEDGWIKKQNFISL